MLSKELAAKPGFVERFKREARAMAKIDHPNVVRCYAVGEDDGLHFVAMELIDGQSMQNWLNELGKLSVPDALHVTLVCAEALEHAHSLNMIHRDIKPDNILVTKKGRREGLRPRARQGPRRRHVDDPERHRPRHAALHAARAGPQRQARRPPQRHLCPRRHAVPLPHRPDPLQRGHDRRPDHRQGDAAASRHAKKLNPESPSGST